MTPAQMQKQRLSPLQLLWLAHPIKRMLGSLNDQTAA
jgi:hypothetical protein